MHHLKVPCVPAHIAYLVLLPNLILFFLCRLLTVVDNNMCQQIQGAARNSYLNTDMVKPLTYSLSPPPSKHLPLKHDPGNVQAIHTLSLNMYVLKYTDL